MLNAVSGDDPVNLSILVDARISDKRKQLLGGAEIQATRGLI